MPDGCQWPSRAARASWLALAVGLHWQVPSLKLHESALTSRLGFSYKWGRGGYQQRLNQYFPSSETRLFLSVHCQ